MSCSFSLTFAAFPSFVSTYYALTLRETVPTPWPISVAPSVQASEVYRGSNQVKDSRRNEIWFLDDGDVIEFEDFESSLAILFVGDGIVEDRLDQR